MTNFQSDWTDIPECTLYTLCNGVFHIFSSFRYWGETFVGISFPWALTNRNRQVWEFYWMHNNLLTIATKLHIRSGRRMRFVSKTWKLQLDTAIYEYGLWNILCLCVHLFWWFFEGFMQEIYYTYWKRPPSLIVGSSLKRKKWVKILSVQIFCWLRLVFTS